MQGSFIKVRCREPYYDGYKSYIYGVSLIGLYTPIDQIQLSEEIEPLRVNQEFNPIDYSRNFWNTALYVGLGYGYDNIKVGMRYNLLSDEKDFVYSDAFMPFVRIYFQTLFTTHYNFKKKYVISTLIFYFQRIILSFKFLEKI